MKNTSTFGTTTPESAKISPICTSLSPFSISLSKNTLPKPESQTTPSISSKLWSLVKTRIHVSYAKLEEKSLTAKTVRVFFMLAVSANTMLVASNAVRRLSNLKMPKWTVQRALNHQRRGFAAKISLILPTLVAALLTASLI